MKTKLNTAYHRVNGMSRTGFVIAFGVLVPVCLTGMLGLKLRATRASVSGPAPLAATGAYYTYEDAHHNLQLAVPVDQLQWHSGVLFRGLESLPLTWG